MSDDMKARLQKILAMRASILGGKFQDDSDGIRLAHAFQSGSYHADRRTFCARMLEYFDDPVQLAALESLRKDGGIKELMHARSVFDAHPRVRSRVNLYLCCHGDLPSIQRELVRALSAEVSDPVTRLRWTQFAIGCLRAGEIDAEPDLGKIAEEGLLWVTAFAWQSAEALRLLSLQSGAEDEKAAEKALLDALSAAGKDEPASVDDGPFDPTAPVLQSKLPTPAITDGIRVVPPFTLPLSGTRTDRHRTRIEMHSIAGVALDRVLTGDVGVHMKSLVARAPNLSDVYETLLGDTGQAKYARFRPTILVGAPGTGKSWSAREIGRTMGLPVTVFGCGGVADSTFGGTSAHWSTSGPNVPLAFILQCRKANPLIVLDEIEKAGTSEQNGRLFDVLLGFLDRGNAAAYRDPSLEMTCDLSHVSYILTANSLSGIPAPLRDRCRIIEVPDPGPEHVPVLARHLIADIAKDRGLDARWFPPLAEDELDVIREGWRGGSIRKLRRAVETLIDGRDAVRGYM